MKCCAAARPIGVLSMLIFFGLFLSCGGFSAPHGEGSAAKLTQIKITPSNPAITKGATLQRTATGIFDDGPRPSLGASAPCRTSQSAPAPINPQGGVTGVNQGAAQMSAAYRGVSGRT